jgi:hypothetical protein
MARRSRRNHGAELKARAALAAIRGDKMLAEIAMQFEVHPHQITENDREFNPASFRASGRWQRFAADLAPPSVAPRGYCACARSIAMPVGSRWREFLEVRGD